MGLFAGTQWELPDLCDRCGQPTAECPCPPQAAATAPRSYLPAAKQRARLRLEKRKGKRVVTVIAGLQADESDLPALLSRLKTACGAGGSLEDDHLVLQGDQLDRASALMTEIGYRIG